MRRLCNEILFKVRIEDSTDYSLVMSVINYYRVRDNFIKDILRFSKSISVSWLPNRSESCVVEFTIPFEWDKIKRCREAMASLQKYYIVSVIEGL